MPKLHEKKVVISKYNAV